MSTGASENQTDLYRAIFNPGSVALVGASDSAMKASSRPLKFLRESGYQGDIYPINAQRDEVGGERAYPSLRELPAVPEHAYIMVPPTAVLDIVQECADRGVAVATILSSGFAEDGPAGAARQEAVLKVARRNGIRLLGPSSLGVVNLHTGLRLTGNAVFGEAAPTAGGTFLASQSGSLIGSIYSRATSSRGFAAMVSVGGEMDLTIGELCALSLDDPNVTDYMLFLESTRGADTLAEFGRQAALRNKPVAVYKVGRSEVAAQLALSHTGALVGQDDISDQLFNEYAIARVDTLEGLLGAAALLERTPIRGREGRPPSVGVITTTGGGAAMVVDQLGLRGVDVVKPSEDTYAKLAAAGAAVSHGQIVDLTLAGTRPEIMRGALDVLLAAPEFDLILAVAGSSARLQPELLVEPIIAAAGTSRPLVAFLVPDAPHARHLLDVAGVPVFQAPEACADVIAAALRRRAARTQPVCPPPPAGVGSSLVLSEDEGYDLLEKLGVTVADRTALTVDERGALTSDGDDVERLFPAAVKCLEPVLAHKSDAGGVVLGVTDTTQLADAVAHIASNLTAGVGVTLRKVLVQRMTRGIGEILVGYQIDPDVGPIVVAAAGGVLTEVYRDRAVRLAPVDKTTASAMLGEIKAVKALTGFRGQPAGDLDAVADIIVSVSQLASSPRVVEAEINPLIVNVQGLGATAVDALVRVRQELPK